MRKIDAISRHLCKSLFSDTFKIDESIKKHTIIETFCMISNRAMVSFFSSLYHHQAALCNKFLWFFIILS